MYIHIYTHILYITNNISRHRLNYCMYLQDTTDLALLPLNEKGLCTDTK